MMSRAVAGTVNLDDPPFVGVLLVANVETRELIPIRHL